MWPCAFPAARCRPVAQPVRSGAQRCLRRGLVLPIQSTIGLTDPAVSLGLTAATDYTTNLRFIDLMKTARDPFFGYENAQYFGDYLDPDGWAHTVPDTGPITYHFDWGSFAETDPSGALLYPQLVANQSGAYVLEFHGQGAIEIRTPTETFRDDDGDGRIEFTIQPEEIDESGTSTTYFGFDIVIGATGAPGNYDPANPTHLRDISLVRAEHEDLFHAGAVFNPEWLEVVDDVRQVRFMDWAQTNDSTVETAADLPRLTDASWAGGVPIEVQVQLANQIGADPWFTIPHGLDAAGTRALVTYVRDTLDPGLVPTFEYSNEVWNPIFAQNAFVQDRAVEWFGDDAYLADPATGQYVLDGSGAPLVSYYAAINAQMILATQTAQIVSEVYADTPELDYINTIGLNTGLGGSADVMAQYLFAPLWQSAQMSDLPAYVPPHTVFDTVAATSYFGGGLLDQDLEAFRAAIDDPDTDIQTWLADYVMGRNADFADPETGEIAITGSVPHLVGTLQAIADSIAAEGLDLGLTLYEGGQHLIHETPGLWEAGVDAAGNTVIAPIPQYDALQAALLDFVRGARIVEAFDALAESWFQIGSGAFVQYGDVKLPGESGAYDLLAHHDDATPRSEAILDLNATQPVLWEDRAGAHFQHGLQPDLDGVEVYPGLTDLSGSDLIDGTRAEDLLYGGEGDDTLFGHDGTDTLAGGAGDDQLQGGTGDDLLHGGAGNDLLRGGSGRDAFRFDGGFGQDTVADFDMTADSLFLDGTALDLSALPAGLTLAQTDAGTLLSGAGGTILLQPADLPAPDLTYGLTGPDAQLFEVDPRTGAIRLQDWFTPDASDPWDSDEDNQYEITVLAFDADGRQVDESARTMTVSTDGIRWQDAPDTQPPTEVTYALTGPDAQLFTVDAATGEIALQDWFSPSLDDPWDADGDHTYELARVATAADGSTTEEPLRMVVTEAGLDWRDASPEPTPEASYALSGPDAHLFTVDLRSGEIGLQDWFIPSPTDAWDSDEDHVYQVTRLHLSGDGTETGREDLEMAVTAEGTMWREAGAAPMTASPDDLLDSMTAIEDPPEEEDAEITEPLLF